MFPCEKNCQFFTIYVLKQGVFFRETLPSLAAADFHSHFPIFFYLDMHSEVVFFSCCTRSLLAVLP